MARKVQPNPRIPAFAARDVLAWYSTDGIIECILPPNIFVATAVNCLPCASGLQDLEDAGFES
jgi:hypothetical protein